MHFICINIVIIILAVKAPIIQKILILAYSNCEMQGADTFIFGGCLEVYIIKNAIGICGDNVCYCQIIKSKRPIIIKKNLVLFEHT